MRDSDVSIIIPAYNESINLGLLVPAIFQSVPRCRIIIVDDSSGEEKNKTFQILQKIQNKNARFSAGLNYKI